MKEDANALRRVVTVVALALALVHVIWPALSIDAITVTLCVIAVLPWLTPLIKSLEVPGVGKVELRELQEISRDAEQAKLLEPPEEPGQRSVYSFESVAEDDPNLALAGLRIEIEKRLGELAEARGIPPRRRGVGTKLRALRDAGAVSVEEYSVLADLVGTLNAAVHGAKVDKGVQHWAMDAGPRLLMSLAKKVGGAGA